MSGKNLKEPKPVNARLPGRLGRMTAAELESETARILSPQSRKKFTAVSEAEWEQTKVTATAYRKRGRPIKPPGDKAVSVLLSIDPKLLAAADHAAAKQNVSRAALIAQGLRSLLKLPA